MKIKYLGHSSFYLVGNDKSVVTDPFTDIGYDVERVEADYCTVSHEHFDHNYVEGVNAGKIIRTAGDGFLAIDSYHDSSLGRLRGKNTIFKFEVDGVTFCHLGDLGEYYSDSLVEEIGAVDVLFIPVGGTYTIDGREAAKFAQAIHAKITIPMHYKTQRSTLDISDATLFLRLVAGVEKVGNEIEITKNTLPQDPVVLMMSDKGV